MTEIEELKAAVEQTRQMQLQQAPRVNALESITHLMIAFISSYDNKPEFQGRLEAALSSLEGTARKRDYGPTDQQLAQWLRDQEVEILRSHKAQILEELQKVQRRSQRSVN